MVVWEAPHASILLFFPCKVCADKVCWKGKYWLFHGSHGKFKLRNFWNPSTALAELRVSPINYLLWLTHFHWPSKHLAKNTKEWTICTASSREGKQKRQWWTMPAYRWRLSTYVRRAAKAPTLLQQDKGKKESPGLDVGIQSKTVLNRLYFWFSTTNRYLSQSKYLQWKSGMQLNIVTVKQNAVRVKTVYVHNVM